MTEEELPDGREEEEGGDADRELEEHSVSCREETAEEDGPGTPLYQTTMDTNILSHEGSMAGDEEELEDGRVSPSTPSQGGGMDPAESPACSEPASDEKGEEGVDERGESGPGGGALVDNLLQILPYWYFFNRAFGMNNLSNSQGGGSSASGLLPSNLTSAMGVGDDQGGDEEDEDSGGTEGRLAAGSQFNAQSAQLNSSSTSSTPQRLNSILLLESLRQQFQSQVTPLFLQTVHFQSQLGRALIPVSLHFCYRVNQTWRQMRTCLPLRMGFSFPSYSAACQVAESVGSRHRGWIGNNWAHKAA